MVRPKKHLGQHFLHDQHTARLIVDAIQSSHSAVIEVGPGTGILTQHLLEEYAAFQAWDVDKESIDFLRSKYPEHTQKFIYQDFLEAQIREPVVIMGNFPYNISSQLFFKIWENRPYVQEVVCMVQKEVAQRICAPHGSKVYGILSVLLQAFYDTKYLFTVPPGAFHPPPKVQSGVIRLTRKEIEKLSCDEVLFKKVVKTAFGKRRKTLRNALKSLDLPKGMSDDNVLFDKRAEQLSVADFVALTKNIASWKG